MLRPRWENGRHGRFDAPVAAGRVTDLRCGIVGGDGHADHGRVGGIVIE
jgi:hypothetical protein